MHAPTLTEVYSSVTRRCAPRAPRSGGASVGYSSPPEFLKGETSIHETEVAHVSRQTDGVRSVTGVEGKRRHARRVDARERRKARPTRAGVKSTRASRGSHGGYVRFLGVTCARRVGTCAMSRGAPQGAPSMKCFQTTQFCTSYLSLEGLSSV